MAEFRFQDLGIWKVAIEIADGLFDIADDLESVGFTDLLISFVVLA